MKHPSSRELFRYWSELRSRRLVPKREDVDPAALRKVLGDSLILSFDPRAGHPIRLAGTRVCALFGRELKAAPFVSLWDVESQPLLRSLLGEIAAEASGVVAGAIGRARSEKAAPLEMLLLPIADGSHTQIIGALAPLVVPYWIGVIPVEAMTLDVFRLVLPETAAPAARQPPARRPAARFVVYEGGASGKDAGVHSSGPVA